MNIYKEATLKRIRFASPRGQVMVEDLWKLPLTQLDTIAKGLRKSLRETDEESFIAPKTEADPTLKIAFEVVKDVITDRLTAAEAAKAAKGRAEQKQKIMAIIAEKETEGLRESSVDDLRKMLEAL